MKSVRELEGAAAACFHSDVMQGSSTERERQRERMKRREERRGGDCERERRTGCTQTSVYGQDEKRRASARIKRRFTADAETWEGR